MDRGSWIEFELGADDREEQDTADEAATRSPRAYTMQEGDYLKRLGRIEGQIRGLQRLVDEDAYCIDVLTQVGATTKALRAIERLAEA